MNGQNKALLGQIMSLNNQQTGQPTTQAPQQGSMGGKAMLQSILGDQAQGGKRAMIKQLYQNNGFTPQGGQSNRERLQAILGGMQQGGPTGGIKPPVPGGGMQILPGMPHGMPVNGGPEQPGLEATPTLNFLGMPETSFMANSGGVDTDYVSPTTPAATGTASPAQTPAGGGQTTPNPTQPGAGQGPMDSFGQKKNRRFQMVMR